MVYVGDFVDGIFEGEGKIKNIIHLGELTLNGKFQFNGKWKDGKPVVQPQ
jgi:hypothetical protein